MWRVALIYIAIASCNAELCQIKTVHLPTTTDGRIIGGSPTTIEKYPFAVQVLNKLQLSCGGFLVTTWHVLSVAHCFVHKKGEIPRPRGYSVRAGTTILNSGGSLHLVTAIKVHDLYDVPTFDNDVAVIMMATAVDLTTSVARLASIPRQDDIVPDNSSVIAIGWGRTDMKSKDPSTVLLEVTVQKISMNTCRFRYQKLHAETGIHHLVSKNMICAGILDVGGKDACFGDSGGPLIYNGVVVGITSWGVDCADARVPGVYVRLASFTNWINYTINESLLPNGICNGTNPGNTGWLGGRIGAITLFNLLLYLILSV